MMGFLHPLLWLANGRELSPGETRIHVLTDSELVAKSGNGQQARKRNGELWWMLDAFRRKGFKIRFHWIPRDTIDLNRFADLLAGKSRKALLGLQNVALQQLFPDDTTALDRFAGGDAQETESPLEAANDPGQP
jgi:ribonuclease HI